MGDLRDPKAADVIVAGHICLDIIPEVNASAAGIRPGILVEAGRAVFSTGGAVANTGIALHRLRINVRLVGKVGDDIFGEVVLKILRGYDTGLSSFMGITAGEDTSYSVIISPPGTDRMFIHSPGCNATFTAADVSHQALSNCKLLHFGYPPLMQAICSNEGAELQSLFRRAIACGLATSLDLSMPDMSGHAGKVDWPTLLLKTLPLVDFFVPSYDELLVMLTSEVPVEFAQDPIAFLAEWAIESGAAIAAIKMGDQGLYVRTAGFDRLKQLRGINLNNLDEWIDREVWVPCFATAIVGTTGSGDATIAGFLMGLIKGMTFDDTLQAACAVGACSVEKSDAVSGIAPWSDVLKRIKSGWPRLPIELDRRSWAYNERAAYWERVRSIGDVL